MPFYEYKCPQCGERIEKLRRMDAPPLKCPRCAEQGTEVEMKRLWSQGNFALKGGGWYKDGYSG